MYKVGDKVVHQREGACFISGFQKMEHDNVKKEYYVLEPLHDVKSKVYVSVDNNNNRMRSAVTQKEMKESEMIVGVAETDWIDDPKVRRKTLLKIIREFEFAEVLLVLKTLMVQNAQKKLCSNDIELLVDAEKLIYSEISIVANKKYETVAEKVKQFCVSDIEDENSAVVQYV